KSNCAPSSRPRWRTIAAPSSGSRPARRPTGGPSMLDVAFTGAVGREPELKTSASGKRYCIVPIAVGNGDATMWIRTAIFGQLAVDFAGTAHKANTVHVEGRLAIGTYKVKDGAERISLDVLARYVRVAEIGRRRRPTRRQRNGQTEKLAPGPNDFHSDPIG